VLPQPTGSTLGVGGAPQPTGGHSGSGALSQSTIRLLGGGVLPQPTGSTLRGDAHSQQAGDPREGEGSPSVAGVQGFSEEGSRAVAPAAAASPAVETPEAAGGVAKEGVADRGERDEAGPVTRLEEPDAEDIKTITKGDTLYQSAKRFEDLPISDPLLQVLHPSPLPPQCACKTAAVIVDHGRMQFHVAGIVMVATLSLSCNSLCLSYHSIYQLVAPPANDGQIKDVNGDSKIGRGSTVLKDSFGAGAVHGDEI